MKRVEILSLFFTITIIFGCEKMVKIDEIDDVISENDLGIELKIDTNKDFEIQRIAENETSDYYLKIIVADEFYLRGKTEIENNKKYKLSVTMKNDNANPIISYSFWKGLKTSLRNYTLDGENGNPPTSKTQEIHSDWVTFDEYFEAQEGEESFMITLFSENGTFYLKDLNIQEILE